MTFMPSLTEVAKSSAPCGAVWLLSPEAFRRVLLRI